MDPYVLKREVEIVTRLKAYALSVPFLCSLVLELIKEHIENCIYYNSAAYPLQIQQMTDKTYKLPDNMEGQYKIVHHPINTLKYVNLNKKPKLSRMG